jgi:hypothetical protein
MISAARWAASWALSVNLSNRIMGKNPFTKPDRFSSRRHFQNFRVDKENHPSDFRGNLSGFSMAIITKPRRRFVNAALEECWNLSNSNCQVLQSLSPND